MVTAYRNSEFHPSTPKPTKKQKQKHKQLVAQ